MSILCLLLLPSVIDVSMGKNFHQNIYQDEIDNNDNNKNNDRLSLILNKNDDDNDECFRCICAASSGCRKNSRCKTIEPNKYLCGPFRLSRTYWKMIANIAPYSHHFHWFNYPFKFEKCSNDLHCSLYIVRKFLEKSLELKCPHLLVKLSRLNDKIDRCKWLSLIHYQAIYGFEDDDFDLFYEQDDYDDDLKYNLSWFNCDNIKRLNDAEFIAKIERLQKYSPSTRSDNDYWYNFFWCSELYLQ